MKVRQKGAIANLTKIVNRSFKEIPIIEYPINSARLGAFEIVLSVLDAINTVQSNRLDGIEQFVQSLIVLINSEIARIRQNY